VAGSSAEQALSTGLVALGEVGLAGEVRTVPGVRRRLAEAGRLGFKTAIVPRGSLELGDVTPLKQSGRPERIERRRGDLAVAPEAETRVTQAVAFEGMTVLEVDNLGEALRVAFTTP
jgi:DNA repair protein RadA/Sms